MKKKKIMKDGGKVDKFGMLSVKAGVDKNPKATKADKIVGAKKSGKKMGHGGMVDKKKKMKHGGMVDKKKKMMKHGGKVDKMKKMGHGGMVNSMRPKYGYGGKVENSDAMFNFPSMDARSRSKKS